MHLFFFSRRTSLYAAEVTGVWMRDDSVEVALRRA